jgi:hypothetical protein
MVEKELNKWLVAMIVIVVGTVILDNIFYYFF